MNREAIPIRKYLFSFFLLFASLCNLTPCAADSTPETQELVRDVYLGEEIHRYLSIAEIQEKMQLIAQQLPEIAEYKVFGQINGIDLPYLRISKAVSDSSLQLPKVLIDGGTHGDERLGVAVVVTFLHRYVCGYGIDEKITELIESRDVYFVPVVNIEGYMRNVRYEQGRDPNRSFPWPNQKRPNNPTPSTACMMQLFEDVGFNATADYHSMGRLVLHPWGYTTQPFNEGPFGDAIIDLASRMGTLMKYRAGKTTQLLHYVPKGTSSDWYYVEGKRLGLNTVAYVVETGLTKGLRDNEILKEADLNYPGILLFIEEAPVLTNLTPAVEMECIPIWGN